MEWNGDGVLMVIRLELGYPLGSNPNIRSVRKSSYYRVIGQTFFCQGTCSDMRNPGTLLKDGKSSIRQGQGVVRWIMGMAGKDGGINSRLGRL